MLSQVFKKSIKMNENEKLDRIKFLLSEKKKEVTSFNQKIKQITEETYTNKLNPLLINFLNFVPETVDKVEKIVEKLGGNFPVDYSEIITRENYELGRALLELNKFKEIFDLFGCNVSHTNADDTYDFVYEIGDILNYMEFAKKHSYKGSSVNKSGLSQIIFNTYLKVVYDERINTLKKPFDHVPYFNIHGIWELINAEGALDEESYLFGHCTKNHTTGWSIITTGLKTSKSFGGRCGAGIYFSNDMKKCLSYSHPTYTDSLGMVFEYIFLVQVYPGKIQQIYKDNGKLTKSDDYDCIHAVGINSPSLCENITHDDGTISKIYIDDPVLSKIGSSFANNEFVIYDEKRCRVKYVILFSRKM